MDQLRFAIVIPCHNDGAAVRDAVWSAVSQPGAEVVVVDDGSTDRRTLDSLDEIRGMSVRVIRQVNAGSAAARMAGVAATSAPYVQPLDADDRLAADDISAVMADYLDSHPQVSAVWGDVQLTGNLTHRRFSASALDPWLVTFVHDMTGPSSMVRRSALLEVGGYQAPDPSRPNCYWDWNFWMSLAERGYAGVNIGRVALEYRVQSGSVNRRCSEAHSELYARLRALHPQLFAERRRNRKESIVPPFARLLIDLVEALPAISRRRRGRLQHAVCQFAFRRGGYMRGIARRVLARHTAAGRTAASGARPVS